MSIVLWPSVHRVVFGCIRQGGILEAADLSLVSLPATRSVAGKAELGFGTSTISHAVTE